MAVLIQMPKLSDTMEEGGIASWLKKEGDSVEEGEPLVEIETDKATMEYASPDEGILLKIIAQPGQAVALQSPIAVLGESGESFDLNAMIDKLGQPSSASAIESSASDSSASQISESLSSEKPISEKTGRIKASPLARKIAKERDISLDDINGSGPHGRIIAKDIGAQKSVKEIDSGQASDRIPLTMMRKTIAKRLLAGKNEAPHFYLTVSANMEPLMELRAELNADKRVEEGDLPKVSVNDLIMFACSRALLQHPEVNSAWQGEYIERFYQAHVAMAVALDSGLVTPVVRHCDRLGIREVATETKRLGKKAKLGGLTPDDYTGGTFTVSNLGMTRIESFTAIINPPQACILAVGRTEATPIVDTKTGAIISQQRMKMTLSCDHRVVDGMVGALFLETLLDFMEKPATMLA